MVVLAALLAALPGAPGALAQDDWGDDEGWPDDDPGFAPLPVAPPPAPPPARNLSVTGFLRSDLELWAERLDDDPFAKWRQSLDLALAYESDRLRVLLAGHAEYDFAYLVDRERFDAATIDTYAYRLLNGEQYLGLTLGPVDLTLGRQIVAWGEGDVVSPLDVVNPRDLREPGLADLDDLRLAVLASRVGFFAGQHRFEAMVVHESYFGERAPPLGEFSPFRAVLADDPMAAAFFAGKSLRYRHVQGRWEADAQQYLGRWVYKGPGVDLGLYGASVLDKQGVVVLPPLAELLTATDIAVPLDHRRYTVAGHSGATAFGSLLLKWEIAADIDRPFNVGDTSAAVPEIDVAEGTLLTGLLNLTWTGISDTTISLEAAKGVFLDEPDDLLFPADATLLALRAHHRLLAERLTLSLAATSIGLDPFLGFLARAEALYELADGVKVGVGYITYQPHEEDGTFGPFAGFEEHDRVFTRLRWDFIAY